MTRTNMTTRRPVEALRPLFEVAKVPDDEEQRLAVLAEYGVLRTAPERDFDDLIASLADVCDVPIALLSLVDRNKQWFKARVGLELAGSPREVSFAAHTILGDDIFEVPDATADPRFAGNPLVTGAPGIRFYAGVPLRSPEGHNLGSVCVVDRVSRRLGEAKREALRQVGREVMVQLERRRYLRAPRLSAASGVAAAGAPSPLAGSQFGRYTILREIGRGATATVYTAYDDQLDRKVAIKLIHDLSIRVEREAHAFARISHPNVVQIYGTGTFGGHAFIAMELVDGVTLTVWQQRQKHSAYEIIAMYAQAGRGLAAAHRAGLVHRDFKPDNVFVDNNGRPRVGDFGLATKPVGAAARDDDVTLPSANGATTRDDVLVGTPAYMAPEQLLNFAFDERADQFGLCAGLYEAVYGVRPFRGATVDELRASAIAGVVQEPLPGVSAPPRLRALLRRGLAMDPAERWPSLTDLLDQLDQLDARRDPGAASRERGRLVAALVVISTIVIAGTAWTARGADTAKLMNMTLMGPTILTVVGLGAYLARATLLRNNYHRRMIMVVFATVLGTTVTRLLTIAGGFPNEQSMVMEMILLGQIFLVAAAIISPMLAINCVIAWAAAAAVVLGAPAVATAAASNMLGLVVFVLIWSFAPRLRLPAPTAGDSVIARRTY